jgi:hypothetical protein
MVWLTGPSDAMIFAMSGVSGEIDVVFLGAVAELLDAAGVRYEQRGAPVRRRERPKLGLWVTLPGEGAYAIVTVTGLVPDAESGWRRARFPHDSDPTAGFEVAFHERPFRTRGHPFAAAAERRLGVQPEDVVAVVREWLSWQDNWSIPVVPPDEATRARRLARLAKSRRAAKDLRVDVDLDPLLLAWLERDQGNTARRLIDELFLPGIRWRFPRDLTGRLASRATVLLHECSPPTHPLRKGIWLAVEGPAPRAAAGLTVRLVQASSLRAQHRWDSMPEYWHAGDRDLDRLWGVRPGTGRALIAEATDALLAGRPLEALTMCGIGVDPRAGRLLAGRPDNFQLREWTDRWVTNAVDLLSRSAPWRWHDAVAPGRRPRRLESLGGYHTSRRPGLFLLHRKGSPYLSFDQSASCLVTPRTAWERDPDYDLVRLGLLERAHIPLGSPDALPSSGGTP